MSEHHKSQGKRLARRESALKKADPRLKIIAVVVWSFLLALTEQIGAAMAGLAGSVILAMISGLPAKDILKRLLTVNFFILFLWLVLPFSFSYPGEVMARLGPLEITRQGLRLTCLLTIKGNAVALGAIAFFGASSVFELTAAARRLGAPEKMTAIFVLMFRYVQVIGQECARLRLAMKARGFKPSMSMHSYRSYANLIGMILIRSLDRASRIHAAMRCRGYNGRFWLSGEFNFKKIDWALGSLMILLICGVLAFAFV
ncbi:MAG: cobalt ECF transporter T component CbiQ [Candidatus Adiutrix sp.]|jgi:cobalt/nickel transport system permease protein|nr:cobalt ECF transporter T component CbiQ [Candidatus Adiutrix sp.]